jgi:homoserine dehydrogenase
MLADREAIAAKSGLVLELRRVAVQDIGKARPYAYPDGLLTAVPEDVVDDPGVDLVVELMGGLDPAASLVRRALHAGKPVVTANKELMATAGAELLDEASRAGVSLLFEAAVGGAIPIIRPLSESLAGEHLTEVVGIVNGTTNFILTQMCHNKTPYVAAVSEAQRLGYAEADPSADVSGADAAAKAAILGSLAFGTWVGKDLVHTEGIEELDVADIAFAADLGYVPKLLAIATDTGAGISVRVHPTLIPIEHPLASVNGAQNAVYLRGPGVGQLLFAGPGAGGAPTATAVLGDIIEAARELLAGAPAAPRMKFAPAQVRPFSELETSWYVRLEVADQAGVLARIAGTFGDLGVSIESMVQIGRGETATLIFVTHASPEAAGQAAIRSLGGLDVVRQVASSIRVLTP